MRNYLNFVILTLSFGLFFSAPARSASSVKEALLIANGQYSHFGSLAHPLPDAERLGKVLQNIGFRVKIIRNGSREAMLDALKDFETRLHGTEAIAFFHYGGHGVQVGGRNYLIPADADIPDERRVATRAVDLDEILGALDHANARANVVVLDACRDNPLPALSGRTGTRGLTVVGAKPKNSIIIYAAEAGNKAVDGLFTPILAAALETPGRTIDQIMKMVRSEVHSLSHGEQIPGEYNQLFEDLFLGELPESDNLPATFFVQNTKNSQSDKVLSFDSALAKADAGDAYAEAVVSIYYGSGIGCVQDIGKSKEYAMRSAQKQNPLGIFRLAEMRDNGEGMTQDSQQATQLMLIAKSGLQRLYDDPYALTALAVILLRENCNSQKVFELLSKASDMGYEPAQRKLKTIQCSN